uniref:G_PROTEIN_RECEP_F1_2 domain-containing protein n=1 Tax=Panagrellus redivivus TaxID=6233 RepID=A0A7E4UY60_PANRE
MEKTWIFFFRDAKRILAPIASPIGVLMNLLLLSLIRYQCTMIMKPFRKALYLTCLSEMLFSAYNLVFVLTVTVQGDSYFAIVEGILGQLSRKWSIFALAGFLLFIYTSVTNNTAVYFYRYLLFCRNMKVGTVQFIFIVAAGWMVVLTYVVLCIVEGFKSPMTVETYAMLEGSEFPFDGSFKEFTNVKLAKIANICTFYGIPMVTLSYIGMITLSLLIYFEFRRLRTLMSKEQKRTHLEISVVLWVEAATPFVTVVIPIYFDLFKIYFSGLEFDWIAEFIWLLTLMGPSFTAVVKIVSIQSFRKWILQTAENMFRKRLIINLVEDSDSLPTGPETSARFQNKVGVKPPMIRTTSI